MTGQDATSEGFDAILMAGDRGAYRSVYGENKAFLQIDGLPVLVHVLRALIRSRRVARVFIVGPRERLCALLEEHRGRLETNKEIQVIGQADTMLENAQMGFEATLPPAAREGVPGSETARLRYRDKAALILGGDIPLVTAQELDEFLEKSDLSRYDYVFGMTREESLAPYYPRPGRPGSGIRFAYFCFRDTRERQNNLHLIRVLRVFNRDLIQTMYRFRYQQRWRNILRLGWRILRLRELTPRILVRFVLLHASRILDRRQGGVRGWLQGRVRRRLNKPEMQQDLSRILKARFGTAVTTYGGAALDVDNERDYQVIKRRYRDWMAYQEELAAGRRNPPAASGTGP